MYIVLEDDIFRGFSLKEEQGCKNIEIVEEEYKKIIEKQSQGFSLYWNKVKKQLETLSINQFEFIDETGNVMKDKEAEIKSYKGLLIDLKKEKIQLKKDIADFEEFEEDTVYLKEQLKEKETEIKELEEQLKKL